MYEGVLAMADFGRAALGRSANSGRGPRLGRRADWWPSNASSKHVAVVCGRRFSRSRCSGSLARWSRSCCFGASCLNRVASAATKAALAVGCARCQLGVWLRRFARAFSTQRPQPKAGLRVAKPGPQPLLGDEGTRKRGGA